MPTSQPDTPQSGPTLAEALRMASRSRARTAVLTSFVAFSQVVAAGLAVLGFWGQYALQDKRLLLVAVGPTLLMAAVTLFVVLVAEAFRDRRVGEQLEACAGSEVRASINRALRIRYGAVCVAAGIVLTSFLVFRILPGLYTRSQSILVLSVWVLVTSILCVALGWFGFVQPPRSPLRRSLPMAATVLASTMVLLAGSWVVGVALLPGLGLVVATVFLALCTSMLQTWRAARSADLERFDRWQRFEIFGWWDVDRPGVLWASGAPAAAVSAARSDLRDQLSNRLHLQLCVLGDAYLVVGDLKKARVAWTQAFLTEPNASSAWIRLAFLARLSGGEEAQGWSEVARDLLASRGSVLQSDAALLQLVEGESSLRAFGHQGDWLATRILLEKAAGALRTPHRELPIVNSTRHF